jgi:hypothetical protein
MEILQCRRDFGCVEPCIFFANTFVRPCLKRTEELSSTAVFHAQIEMVFRLERVVQCDDERVIARSQNLLLRKRALDFVPLDHFFLAQDW